MKKYIWICAIAVIGLAACRKNTTPTNVVDTITIGNWKVAKMVHKDTNITNSLGGFHMVFGEDRVFTVVGYDTTFAGSWEVPTNAKRPAKLFINFTKSHKPSQPLSDDWLVTYRTKEEVHLERLNGKLGSKDQLIIRKR